MPDREKVIKGLQDAEISLRGFANHFQPLREECREQADACHDALALLEEQEAKPPAIMQDIEGIWSTCSMCGHKLRPILAMKMDTYLPKFCSKCGQAVKWE